MTKPSAITDGAIFDITTIDRELRSADAYKVDGHTARTLVREPAMRIVLIVMRAGAKIAEHHAHETASIHSLAGHMIPPFQNSPFRRAKIHPPPTA